MGQRSCIVGLSLICIVATGFHAAAAATITYSEPLYLGRSQDVRETQAQVDAWAADTGNTAVIHQLPGLSNSLLGIYQQLFLSQSSQIDIFRIDVIWIGILKNHLIDLKSTIPDSHVRQHFPSIVTNNTDAAGRLLAVPFFADVGLLFYRKDLLEKHGFSPPETWDDLQRIALHIVEKEKGSNPDLAGFVFQGKNHEGLTCNALEWIDSFLGGTIVDAGGDITVNNPNAVKALQTAASWIGTISPRDVLAHTHENTQERFQTGNAVFARNWPYVWALSNRSDSAVKDKVGVAPLPKGGENGKHSGTLGGWGLAVSKYAGHPEQAADLVRHMTTAALQFDRAVTSGLNPTIPEVYLRPELAAAHPYIEIMRTAFTRSVARPSTVTGLKYNKVSMKFSTAVHQVLSGTSSAADALQQLESELLRIKASDW